MTTTTTTGVDMQGQTEFIGPDGARALLECLPARQRTVSPHHIDKLDRLMRQGKYRLTAEPIMIDTNGDLINGQHRLRAVVQSGCTVPFLVVRGVPPESFAFIDQGRRRSAAQFREGPHADPIMSAARMLHQIEQHLTYNAGSNPPGSWLNVDINEQLAYAEGWPELVDWAPRAETIGRSGSLIQVPARFLLSVVAQAARTDWAEEIDGFLAGLHGDEPLGRTDPRALLGRRLRGTMRSYLMSPQGADFTYSLVVKAWNLHISGDTATFLKMAPGERRTTVHGSKASIEAHKEPVVVPRVKKIVAEDDQ